MAQTIAMDHYYPFPSVAGDRKVSAADVAALFATFFTTGICPVPTTSLQVLASEGMTLQLQPGCVNIQGRVGRNDSAKQVVLGVADGVLPRIDRMVARCDYPSRYVSTIVKEGQPASKPVAPALQRDSTGYELAIADVLVAAGATKISQSAITDRRPDPTLCGWMGLIDGTDTGGLFTQWGAEFHEWFANIQGLLDDDALGNVANQILALQTATQAAQATASAALPKANVVNNLTSTDTAKALSAAQGKALKDYADSKKVRTEILWSGTWSSGSITIANLDNYRLFEFIQYEPDNSLGSIVAIGLRSGNLLFVYAVQPWTADGAGVYATYFSVSGNTLTWQRGQGIGMWPAGHVSIGRKPVTTYVQGVLLTN